MYDIQLLCRDKILLSTVYNVCTMDERADNARNYMQ